jgi:hypothetical protein
MSNPYVKVVTCPEQGWDCVVRVFTDHVSDADIRKEWPADQYVIHREQLRNIVEPH